MFTGFRFININVADSFRHGAFVLFGVGLLFSSPVLIHVQYFLLFFQRKFEKVYTRKFLALFSFLVTSPFLILCHNYSNESLVFSAVFVVTDLLIACSESVRRKFPGNLICLFLLVHKKFLAEDNQIFCHTNSRPLPWGI